MQSYNIHKKVSRVGFEWEDLSGVLEKLSEEIEELNDAVQAKRVIDVEEEFGDILFVLVNVAKRFSIKPELALIQANKKFMRRFNEMLKIADSKNVEFEKISLSEKEALWQEVKKLKRVAEVDAPYIVTSFFCYFSLPYELNYVIILLCQFY